MNKRLRPNLRFLQRTICVGLWSVAVMGFYFIYHWPLGVALVLGVSLPLVAWRWRKEKIFTAGAVIGFMGMVICVGSIQPRGDRDWALEFSVLPRIDISDQRVHITGFRNFQWQGPTAFDPVWEKRAYDFAALQSLDLIVEPFKDSDYMAHTMLRFGFGDGEYVIVSVEARREQHEEYSLWKGAFRQFELIYLFGSEEDLLTLRAVHGGTRLYVYPVKADRAFIVKLFKDLASSANALHEQPQFYRSIRDNCTTTLVKHVDRQQPKPIGLRTETFFPAMTGRLLYDMGFMDTDLSYEDAKRFFRVDEQMRENAEKGV